MGSKAITDDFMDNADRLTAERQELELKKTKLTTEINFRENAVADKEVIAKALLRFEEVIKQLEPAEQKELVQLIVKEISVKHFDPSADPKPQEKGIFDVRIRTKYYLVNISIFASDLIPETWEFSGKSSDLKRIGSKGRARTPNCPKSGPRSRIFKGDLS